MICEVGQSVEKGNWDERNEKKMNGTESCVWGKKMNDETCSAIVIAC